MARAVDEFVRELKARGVEWMATLAGHGLDPLLAAAAVAGLRLLDTRTEQAASYAAEAYGRLTRRPGVCAVSSGPGLVNALSGLAMAWFDRTPMLLVSGAGELSKPGHYQQMDQAAVAAPLAELSQTIDAPERVRQAIDQAFQRAGPAHLSFPLDVQNAELGTEPPLPDAAPPELPGEDPEQVGRRFDRSERPVIVAGTGVYYAGSGPALLEFAERAAIPVVQPIWDRGIVDRPSPVFAGIVGASSGGPRLLEDADFVLLAGAIADYRVHPAAEVAYLERSWPRPARSHRGWLEEARRRAAEFRRGIEERAAGQARRGLHAVHILEALRGVMGEETCLLIDGGAIGQWAHHLLCSDRYPGRWLTNGRSGAVGWGLGAAMGARLAFPRSPVILLSGDGAFTFTVAEIETAVRHHLPFAAIVADDRGWGLLGGALGAVDFCVLASALGARGVRAETPAALRAELEHALDEDTVTVIHAPIVGGNPS